MRHCQGVCALGRHPWALVLTVILFRDPDPARHSLTLRQLFSGTGLLVMRASGPGALAIASYGAMLRYRVQPGEAPDRGRGTGYRAPGFEGQKVSMLEGQWAGGSVDDGVRWKEEHSTRGRALRGCVLEGCALRGCVLEGCALEGVP